MVWWYSCTIFMVKNNPTMAKSAAMATQVSWVSGKAKPARVYIPRNKFGVVAHCRFGTGPALAKALKRERVAGSSWAEPGMCKGGLGWRLLLDAVAR